MLATGESTLPHDLRRDRRPAILSAHSFVDWRFLPGQIIRDFSFGSDSP